MATIDGYPVGVTRADTDPQPPGAPVGSAVHLFLGPAGFPWGGLLAGVRGADGLPPWGTVARDQILRRARFVSGLWGSVVMKAVTKIAGRGYTLEDSLDSQQRLTRARLILERYGPGWTRGLARGMQDFLQTNMGQVIAIERAALAPGARITGLIHLDALRCTPTSHPDYPLLYTSPQGRVHLLPAWGVIRITDMADADDLAAGYGQCATDRAWDAIIEHTAITTYFREKITGSRNLSIFIIRGLRADQLRDALATSEATAEQRAFVVYKGSTIIPLMSDVEIQLTEIPLASVPDGFDVAAQKQDIHLRMANAMGVPVQDIQPLSGQGLGTGTQSVIQDEAFEGMGVAVYPTLLAEAINASVLPDSTTFKIYTNDIRDQKATAEVQKLRAETRAARIAAGEITADEARQLALDAGDLPPELMQQADATPGGTLDSDEKPLVLAAPAPALPLATKARIDDTEAARLVAAALNDARAWAWAQAAVTDGDA